MSYLRGVWDARHFWVHLALSDLRYRWRRSYLGALWSVLQPLGMTLLLSLVFSRIFRAGLGATSLYILSGMLVWDFVMATAVQGSLAFVQADAYIKQVRRPLAIYTLRAVLSNLIVLALAGSGLVLAVLASEPSNLGWCWLAALLVFPLAALIAWPLSTALAYAGVRFRDIPHSLSLVFQALWFVSPVYIQAEVYRASRLGALVDLNPVYHLLELVRAPLLRGAWPTGTNVAFCLAAASALSLTAWLAGRRLEERVIFYL